MLPIRLETEICLKEMHQFALSKAIRLSHFHHYSVDKIDYVC
jgi:hypothetical protein